MFMSLFIFIYVPSNFPAINYFQGKTIALKVTGVLYCARYFLV